MQIPYVYYICNTCMFALKKERPNLLYFYVILMSQEHLSFENMQPLYLFEVIMVSYSSFT